MFKKLQRYILNYKKENTLKTILLTGGGSAGHVVPNLALLPQLEKMFDEIHYIGSLNGIEKNIISNYPKIKYHGITAVKLERSLTLKNLLIPFKLISSTMQARKIIKSISPSVMFSKGGFVSVAPAFAASMKKVPIVSHESDFSMGLANKLIYKVSKVMCFSFSPLAKKYKKGVFSGSPIRQEIFAGNKQKVLSKHNLSAGKINLLIMGGSLGAVAINKVIRQALDELLKNYNVLHIVGKNNIDKKCNQKGYVQIEYTNEIQDYLACADIIISRSGSNSIFEFLALNKPMILIPLPKTASRGDQILNANHFKKLGYAEVIYQEDLTKSTLLEKINNLNKSKQTYIANMKKASKTDAVEIIINEIKKVMK